MLTNDKCVVTVGDPWNYLGADGANRIVGIIIRIVSEDMIVFQSSNVITLKGKETHFLVLSPRYTHEHFTPEIHYIPITGVAIEESIANCDETELYSSVCGPDLIGGLAVVF